MSGQDAMSLEAAMDEERKAILEILERQTGNKKSSPPQRRPDSPSATPRSPIRSMLDVGDDASPARKSSSPRPPMRYRSMLDVDGGRPRNQQQVQSMLDAEHSSDSLPGPVHSAQSSVSDAGPQAAPGGSPRSTFELPRSERHASPQRNNPLAEYQFADIITSQLGQSLPMPRRNQQGGRNSTSSPLSQTHAAPSTTNIAELPRHSISGSVVRRGNQSTSPHGRRSLRGLSPNPGAHPGSHPGSQQGRSNSRMMTLDSGSEFDLGKAYKKLSNANLMASEGPLAALAYQKAQAQEDGEGRLEKAYLGPDGEGLYTSSEDDSGNEDEGHRGRSAAPRIVHSSSSDTDVGPPNLLAAADDERESCHEHSVKGEFCADVCDGFLGKQQAARPYKVRSLFEADDEEKRKLAANHEVNPTSTVNSANNSENEIERDEIKKAQEMAVQLTDVFSDPDVNRSVRVIYRGDFTKVVSTAAEEHKTLRKYLVATDMSDHSHHALEWAVGTVLRDGDTLVVVRCLDEESEEGIGSLAPPPATAHRSSSISALTSGGQVSNGGDSGSSASAPDKLEGTSTDKLEAERNGVVEDLTAKVSRLLRRTKLQVRVIVEVIHCRNPKHLVLEMIDLIKPTLVILGSRGRSAIKG